MPWLLAADELSPRGEGRGCLLYTSDAADELIPRGEGRGAAADEAAHLDAHKNRSSDLVRVKKHIDLQGQTYVGQHKLNRPNTDCSRFVLTHSDVASVCVAPVREFV